MNALVNKMVCFSMDSRKKLMGNGKKLFAGAILAIILTALIVPILPQTAYGVAADGTNSGGDMPWEKPLSALAASLTGPTTKFLSLIMIVVGIAVLMFGGDIAGWGRWIAFACLAIGTLSAAPALLTALGVTGAIIY